MLPQTTDISASEKVHASCAMIQINDVCKWYGSTFQVLKDCTTEVKKGEVVVVCGPSGSGKSTLIKCVNALEPIQSGSIAIDGVRVNDAKTNLAIPSWHGVPALRTVPASHGD
jgi:ABC-type polar amino acid transport system ATPase subunit